MKENNGAHNIIGAKRLSENSILLYSIIFCLTTLLIFGWFAIYNKSLVYTGDAYYQHYPLLVQLRRVCSDFFHGKGFDSLMPFVGQGVDTFGNFSIMLTDPFNYIAAAFPVSKMDIGYSVAYVLRMYCAGLSALVFFRSIKFSSRQQIIGAISYALCVWAIMCRSQAFFVNPLILFPLLILGIDKVFEGKRPYLLIFSIIASLITYFYFAYMSAIGCVVYVIFKLCFDRKLNFDRTAKNILKIWSKLIAYIIIAVLLASIVLVPMLVSVMNTSTEAGVKIKYIFDMRQFALYLTSLFTTTQPIGNYSFMCVNAFMLALFPAMIMNLGKKERRFPAIVAVFFLLMAAFPAWSSMMNGFSYSVGRWYYILMFFLIWGLTDCIEDMDKEKSKALLKFEKIWVIALALILIIAVFVLQAGSSQELCLGIFNIAGMMYFMFYRHKKVFTQCLAVGAQIGLFFIIYFNPVTSKALLTGMNHNLCYDNYQKSLLQVKSSLNPNYRIETSASVTKKGEYTDYSPARSANEGIYWNANDGVTYLSTLNSNFRKYNEDLGNSSSVMRRTIFCGYDNRYRMQMLAGVKYYLTPGEDKNKYGIKEEFNHIGVKDGVRIYKSKYDTSLGYMFYNAMSEEEYEKLTPIQREQALMENVVLSSKEMDSLTDYYSDAKYENKAVKINSAVSYKSSIKPVNNKFSIENDDKFLEINLNKFENCELYVQINGMYKEAFSKEKTNELEEKNSTDEVLMNKVYIPRNNFTIDVIKGKVTKGVANLTDKENQANKDLHDFTVNMGYFSKVDGSIKLKFSEPGNYSYDSIEVYAIPIEAFETQAKNLESRGMDVVKYGDDVLKGNVNAKDDGILYLSVPKQGRWTAYVDGEQTEIYSVNTAYMGIPVKKGNHKIELKYRSTGAPIVYYMTAAGILGLSSIIGWDIYSTKKKKRAALNSEGDHK